MLSAVDADSSISIQDENDGNLLIRESLADLSLKSVVENQESQDIQEITANVEQENSPVKNLDSSEILISEWKRFGAQSRELISSLLKESLPVHESSSEAWVLDEESEQHWKNSVCSHDIKTAMDLLKAMQKNHFTSTNWLWFARPVFLALNSLAWKIVPSRRSEDLSILNPVVALSNGASASNIPEKPETVMQLVMEMLRFIQERLRGIANLSKEDCIQLMESLGSFIRWSIHLNYLDCIYLASHVYFRVNNHVNLNRSFPSSYPDQCSKQTKITRYTSLLAFISSVLTLSRQNNDNQILTGNGCKWRDTVIQMFGIEPAVQENPETNLTFMMNMVFVCMRDADLEYVQLLSIQCFSILAQLIYSESDLQSNRIQLVQQMITASHFLPQPLLKKVAQSFQTIIGMSNSENELAIWNELDSMSWSSRIKYLFMTSFLKKSEISVDSDIIENCFQAAEVRELQSYGAELLSTFLQRSYKINRLDPIKWQASWLERLKIYAENGHLEKYLRVFELHYLPCIAHSWPEQFLKTMELCEQDTSTPVLLLLVMYKVCLDDKHISLSELSLQHVEELLLTHLHHENYVCNLLTLSIIVQTEKRYHNITDGRFTVLFLDFLRGVFSPHLNTEFLDVAVILIKKYFIWHVDFVSKRSNMRSKLSRQSLLFCIERAASGESSDWIDFYKNFLDLMFSNLFDGASFARSSFALKSLACLFIDALNDKVSSQESIFRSPLAIKIVENVKPHMDSFYAENRRIAIRLVEALYPFCGDNSDEENVILDMEEILSIFDHLQPLYRVEGAVHAMRILWPYQSVEMQGHIINSLYGQLFDSIYSLASVFESMEKDSDSEMLLSKPSLIRKTRDSPISGIIYAFETLMPLIESTLSAQNFSELILMMQKVMQLSAKFFYLMYQHAEMHSSLQDEEDPDERNESDDEGCNLDECDILTSDHIVQAGTKYLAILQRFFWRAIQYSSNLLVTLLVTPSIIQKFSEGIWLQTLHQSIDLMQVILWKSRHWGAVKALFGNFTKIFRFLNNFDDDLLTELRNIQHLRQYGHERLNAILTQVINGSVDFNVERGDARYAGLAYSIQAIVLGEAGYVERGQMLDYAVNRISSALSKKEIVEQARLNLLNIFLSLCKDRHLGNLMQRHALEAIKCSLDSFISPGASSRSTATALFTGVVRRFFDPNQSAYELFCLFPGLESILYEFINEQASSMNANHSTLKHNAFPILLLLSHSSPDTSNEQREENSESQNLIWNRWKPLLVKLLGNPIWKVREMTAKAIQSLIPVNLHSVETNWVYDELLSSLNEDIIDQNYVHGLTMLLDFLLFARPGKQEFAKLENLIVIWTSRLSVLSPLSSAQLCETFETILLWMELQSQTDVSWHTLLRCMSDILYICFRSIEKNRSVKGPGRGKFRYCCNKVLFTILTNPHDILKWNISFLQQIQDEDAYVAAISVLRYRLSKNELDGRIANEVKLYQFQWFLNGHASHGFMSTNKVRYQFFRLFLEIEQYTRSPADETHAAVLQRIIRRIIHSTLISSCPSSVRCVSLECLGYLLSINQQPEDDHMDIFLNFMERWSRPDRAANYRLACLLALQPMLLRASLENRTRCLLWLILMRFLSTEDEPEILKVLVGTINQIAGGLPGLMDFNLARTTLAEMLMGNVCRQTATLLYDGCLLIITLDSHWLSMLESPFSGIFQSIPMHSAPPGSKREPFIDLQVWILPLFEKAVDFLEQEGILSQDEFLHDFKLVNDIIDGTKAADERQRAILSKVSLKLFSAVRNTQQV